MSWSQRASSSRRMRPAGVVSAGPTRCVRSKTLPDRGTGTNSSAIGAAGPQAAVLDPVAADLHPAPGALAVSRAVVEGPAAFAVGAEPKARPAAVELGIANDEDQRQEPIGELTAVAGVDLVLTA